MKILKIKISIINDKGETFEGEMELNKLSKSRKSTDMPPKPRKNWYEVGSTIHKIVKLVEEGFFNTNRSLSDIIEKFQTMDYTFKGPDLTLPLRKVVRQGLLIRTKDLSGGKKSKNWTWIKN